MIVSVIVTHNRKSKMIKSIDSLLAANLIPDKIIVIDNFSTDGSAELLDQLALTNERIKIFHTNKNLGGAGGFALGLKLAYDMGAAFMWINDDDSYVEHNSLQELLNAKKLLDQHNLPFSFLCSKVNWIDGEICEMNSPVAAWDWMRHLRISSNLVKIDSCSFVSCLISKEYLEKAGLPIIEFFIWYDDAEFTSRLANLAPGYTVLNSLVVHDMAENKGVNFGLLDDSNLWKYESGARNEAWVKLTRYGKLAWFSFCLKRYLDMRKAYVPGRLRWAIMKACFSALFKTWKIQSIVEFNPKLYLK